MRKSTVAGGRCRTRIVTEGVIPSLHVYYKNTHLKQYHKTGGRGAGLRTETTINNSYDFGVGRLLGNLPKLREIGFGANRRMLEVEKASHDCRIGAQTFEALQSPASVEGQRASALRFGDARVQCLFAVLLLLCLQLEGFRNRQLRPLLAQMLGLEESNISAGRVSYELRSEPMPESSARPSPLSPAPPAARPRQWFAPSINSNQKSMLILSKRPPEKLDSNTPTSSVQGL